MIFAELGLSPEIQQAVAEQGYDTPTPIQAQAIPAVLKGQDVMAAAQTGTGKTAGFTLPMLERLCQSAGGNRPPGNQVRALVLTPTRELAAQVGDNVAQYSRYVPIKSTVVFGGVKINPQMMRLRGGVDILVATPGRLLDLYQQGAVKFDALEILVLDEADRMLDMGFIHDIRKIMALMPSKRQNLMFSATFSPEIRQLAKTIVRDPVEITVNPPNSTATRVKQWIYPVDKKEKTSLLIELIKINNWHQVLVFSRTKHGANKLVKQLDAAGLKAAAIHGNKSQGARTRALADFKANKVRILVATDIAARGVDIDQLPQVVNFDLPQVAEDYVHRIGRTGRAGAEGAAVSLVSADEFDMLSEIERLIKTILPREFIVGFEPQHALPESSLEKRGARNNRSRSGNPRNKKPSGNKPKKPSQGRNRSADSNKPETKSGDGKPAAKKSFWQKKKAGNGGGKVKPFARQGGEGKNNQ
ncbi:DEAD/DEAH box helicase [Gilvimarinus xylanilyticus]|uniref:ATP-dependent RNA helicase RhlE n=1 Tax=Gilvimarinus xylanilyticus TaxID=2944139 RepID=A0A9X2HVB0_9GAMM|nr:DEAD/DEAH box helicase [Gilvimarinus xylanilyticus]MCP8897684.1 DEAD/DEAH box helicase [Gilvimarinus xylanilyticus]